MTSRIVPFSRPRKPESTAPPQWAFPGREARDQRFGEPGEPHARAFLLSYIAAKGFRTIDVRLRIAPSRKRLYASVTRSLGEQRIELPAISLGLPGLQGDTCVTLDPATPPSYSPNTRAKIVSIALK